MNAKQQLIVAPLLACALLSSCTKSVKTDVKSPTPVKVETVQSYSPSAGARYSASIIPGSQVALAFSVGGYADRVLQVKGADGRLRNIQQGDCVARGQALAGVRLKDYAVRVDQASGQLEQARASLVTSARQVTEVEVAAEKARLDFDRAQALYSSQSMTKSEYDAAKSQHDLYQAKIETAKSQLAFIKAQITAAEAAQTAATISRDDTLLKSPLDGLILQRDVEVGELVAPGKPVFILADTAVVKAEFGVPDLEVQTLKTGSALTVELDALPGREFTGQITSISPSADQKTRLFSVEVSIRNPDRSLKVGMIASLTLAASSRGETVAVVPLNAIVRSKDRPDQYSVFVVDASSGKERVRLQEVTLGDAYGNRVAVKSGLKVGEIVITSGGSRLFTGEDIQIIP
jgi:RND family efflux transporter MFP subunit